jgi:exopolyphosphatase/guanosine-5'-triphosphate,3'-diphosphate pyrophosphatase
VLHLAQNYGVDPERAARVAGHALSLYDQTRGLLHSDGGVGRHLLWAAARLHACGKHINIAAYHKHTWYLIRHGELLGHSQNEHLMVAAIARYHRRGLPKKRHESWQLIEGRELRRTVQAMALLLRLAAALDRRPAALIAALKVSAEGPRDRPSAVVIDLEPVASAPDEAPVDLTLERWSLGACAPVVLELTGLSLRVPGLVPQPTEAAAGAAGRPTLG